MFFKMTSLNGINVRIDAKRNLEKFKLNLEIKYNLEGGRIAYGHEVLQFQVFAISGSNSRSSDPSFSTVVAPCTAYSVVFLRCNI